MIKTILQKYILDDHGGQQQAESDVVWACYVPTIIAKRNAAPRRKLMNHTAYEMLRGRSSPLTAGAGFTPTLSVQALSDIHKVGQVLLLFVRMHSRVFVVNCVSTDALVATEI